MDKSRLARRRAINWVMTTNNISRSTALLVVALAACASTPKQDPDALAASPVPQVVGGARLTETDIFPRRRPGIGYRYRAGEMRADVYLFLKGDRDDPRQQAEDFLEELRIMRLRGDYDGYDVQREESLLLSVGTHTITGSEVVFRTQRRARRSDEYFAAVALPEQYVTFRVVQPLSESSADSARAFMHDWITAHLKQRDM